MSKVEKKRGRISVLKSYAGHQHRAVNSLQFCLEHNLNFKAKGCWRKTLDYSSSFLDLHLDSMKTLGTVILFVVNGSFLSLLSSRQTEGYSGSDLTALARDAALGPIRGEKWLQSLFCANLWLDDSWMWLIWSFCFSDLRPDQIQSVDASKVGHYY